MNCESPKPSPVHLHPAFSLVELVVGVVTDGKERSKVRGK